MSMPRPSVALDTRSRTVSKPSERPLIMPRVDCMRGVTWREARRGDTVRGVREMVRGVR